MVDSATDQPDRKAVVGGAFSAAAETHDQVVGFFAPFGRALVAAANPDRGAHHRTDDDCYEVVHRARMTVAQRA